MQTATNQLNIVGFILVTTVIHNEPAKRGSGPCSVLKWSTEGGQINLFTGFSTGKVASLTLEGGILRKESALSFGVAVRSFRCHVKGFLPVVNLT
jgi:hypothetical protein